MTTKEIVRGFKQDVADLEKLKLSLTTDTTGTVEPQLWGCTSCSPSDSIVFSTNFGREIEDNELFCPICGANTTYDLRGLPFSEVTG